MHITLYRKYRPKSFEEVAGENEIVSTIKSSIKNNRLAHAYLFTGPRGVGKTTVARLLAKATNCLDLKEDGEPCNVCANCNSINEGSFLDLIEIDAASNRGIDEIRLLKEKINYQPSEGKKKIYIIDEVHMLTKEAFNALLKTLEEPPAHVLFILATTEPDKILPTIISRCQRYDFKTVSLKEMKDRLKIILENENIEIEEEVYELIYENSGGSMRDSISILERLIVTELGTIISLERSEKILGVTPVKKISDFLAEIANKNHDKLVKSLDDMWNNSIEVELFFKDLAKQCKNLMSKKEIETELALNIISVVYDTLAKFKFEEDKRLVGYVIVNDLLASKAENVKVIEKVVEVEKIVERNIPQKSGDLTSDKDTIEHSVTFEKVKEKWTDILNEARKEKISLGAFLINGKLSGLEGNDIVITYDAEYSFCKEQMETSTYNNILLKSIANNLGANLNTKYHLVGKLKNKNDDDDEFVKKLTDFMNI